MNVRDHEVSNPAHVAELKVQGMHVDRQIKLASGETSTLMRLTALEARAHPYARFSGLFFPPKPRFFFSQGEQRLLEHSLIDESDEEVAEEPHLPSDAVKKRWRSVDQSVGAVNPELLVATDTGIARRRRLLKYLRYHMEELRPYMK